MEHATAAANKLTNPPQNLVRIGSGFAALYLYDTFEKLGMDDTIRQEIYKQYLPMVEAAATTVWESFPSGTTGRGGYLTRSHCLAWSGAPSRFLNRIVLGRRPPSSLRNQWGLSAECRYVTDSRRPSSGSPSRTAAVNCRMPNAGAADQSPSMFNAFTCLTFSTVLPRT